MGISESQNFRISDAVPPPAYVSKFRDLKVYQKAFDVSLTIHSVTASFPKYEQYGGLGDQMRRASKSICANLAEGYAKQQGSKADFKRFVLIALGSAHEMQVWSDYALALQYISNAQASDWSDKYDEICRMLQSLYSKT